MHGFQKAFVDYAIELGLNVVVKPHPAMFKNNEYARKDRDYFELLLNMYPCHLSSQIQSLNPLHRGVFFVDSRSSVVELARVFPGFMCVTQHGSVAAECGAMNLMSVVGENSQYFDGDAFVKKSRRSRGYGHCI